MSEKNIEQEKMEEKENILSLKKISEIVLVVIFSFVGTYSAIYFIGHVFNKAVDNKVQIARNEIVAEFNKALAERDKNYEANQKILNSNVHVVDKRFNNLQKQINDIWKRRNDDVIQDNAIRADINKSFDEIWKRYDEDVEIYNKNQTAFELRLRTIDDEQNRLISNSVEMRTDLDFQEVLSEQQGEQLQNLLVYRHWLEGKFFGALAMPKE